MPFKNILLIDDDEDDQEIFLAALSEISGSVECVCIDDAKQALDKLSARELVPEAIFLDLNMPLMNGQQFLEQIKTFPQLGHIPVIIFSTSANPETIARTIQLGAQDFITKPSTLDRLVDILKPFIAKDA